MRRVGAQSLLPKDELPSDNEEMMKWVKTVASHLEGKRSLFLPHTNANTLATFLKVY